MAEEWWITTNEQSGTRLACNHYVSREEARERAVEFLGLYVQASVPGDHTYDLRCSMCSAHITMFRIDRILGGKPASAVKLERDNPNDELHYMDERSSSQINLLQNESTRIFVEVLRKSRHSK